MSERSSQHKCGMLQKSPKEFMQPNGASQHQLNQGTSAGNIKILSILAVIFYNSV